MFGKIITTVIAAVIFMVIATTFYNLHSDTLPQSVIEEVNAQPAAPVLTPAERASLIEQGNTIIGMALDEFEANPSQDMGLVLLQITEQYNYMLGALCEEPGNEAACSTGVSLIGRSYETLIEYAKTLE